MREKAKEPSTKLKQGGHENGEFSISVERYIEETEMIKKWANKKGHIERKELPERKLAFYGIKDL